MSLKLTYNEISYSKFVNTYPQENKEVKTIVKTEQKSDNYHALYCNNSDMVVYSCYDGKTFLNRILHGVHNAIVLEAEKEKQQRLDLYDWQNEQDRISVYKEVMKKWIETYRKKKIERIRKIMDEDK